MAIRGFELGTETDRMFADAEQKRAERDVGKTEFQQVVDASGISSVALLGDMIAEAGVKNNWSGIVINGYVRDIDVLGKLNLGIQALGAMPVRSEKKNQGQVGIDISFGGLTFCSGDYVYADNNGLLLSKKELILS